MLLGSYSTSGNGLLAADAADDGFWTLLSEAWPICSVAATPSRIPVPNSHSLRLITRPPHFRNMNRHYSKKQEGGTILLATAPGTLLLPGNDGKDESRRMLRIVKYYVGGRL